MFQLFNVSLEPVNIDADDLEKTNEVPSGLRCIHLTRNIIPAKITQTPDALSQVIR